jgi:hypothetical protein
MRAVTEHSRLDERVLMPVRSLGVVTAIAAGLLFSACGSSASSAPPTTPGVHLVASFGTREGVPIDVGRARLWLPKRWRLETAPCPSGSTGCTPACPPGVDDAVYVATDAQVDGCFASAVRTDSVWLVPERVGTGQTTWRRLAAGRGSVDVSAPKLGVTIFGFGPQGARIALGVSASTLDLVLATTLPTPVPAGWHRVSYRGLSVAVPPEWPITRLGGPHSISPGSCGFDFFPHPRASTGFGAEVLWCPLISADTELVQHSAPANGVWLRAVGAAGTLPSGGWGATTSRDRTLHGLTLQLSIPLGLQGADYLSVVVHHGANAGELVVGLGRTPGVATAILSSLRLRAR